MRVESTQVFRFFFQYEGTELMIPLAGANEEDARGKLRGLFSQWINDLSMPTGAVLSPVQQKETPMPTIPGTPIMELRIEELLRNIADARLKVVKGTVAATIKDWTGFKHDPANFPAIIEELEKIKRGHE